MIFDFTEVQKTKMQLLKCEEMIKKLLKSDIFYADNYVDDQNEKIAVYSTTSNTFDMLRASLKSLYYNSDVDRVILITDTDEIPVDFPKELEVITMKKPPDFFVEDGPNLGTKWTYFCLLRVGLHRIFPKFNKILSLDYDTIIRKDISDLWDINLGSRYYVAGVLEPRRTKGTVYGYDPFDTFKAMSTVQFKSVNYINGGVMLMNLKQLRDDGTGDDMIDIINDRELFCPEQDAVNAICHRNIYALPPTYNSMEFSYPVVDAKIVHYATEKNKIDHTDAKIFVDKPWSEIKKRREIRYKKPLTISEFKNESNPKEIVKNDVSLKELANKRHSNPSTND